MSFRVIPPLALVVLAVSCSQPADPAASPGGFPGPVETDGSLNPSKIPVLRSAYLEKNWGLPKISTFDDGSYRLTFRQGTTLNYVFILGVVDPKPVPAFPPNCNENSFSDDGEPVHTQHKQEWRQTSILGTPVKWYQHDNGGGADFPCYKTVDFPLTAPDGRTGHYRIEVCSDTAGNAADWINRVNW